MHSTPVKRICLMHMSHLCHQSSIAPVYLVISLNESLWLLGRALNSTHRHCRSRVLLSDFGAAFGPRCTNWLWSYRGDYRLEQLLFNLILLPASRVQARTEYTLLRRPPMRIGPMCKSFRSEKDFLQAKLCVLISCIQM